MPTSPSAITLFSGAGGSSTGYHQAGYTVVWANEFVPAAADTYRANHPDTILDTRDIRTVTAHDILTATGLRQGDLDLLDGSPPCASFSTGGSRSANWGKINPYSDTHQRTDDLFNEYIRILHGLQPRTFVAENVVGLTRGPSVGVFKNIYTGLERCGYRVETRTLDAAHLGVPQRRRRIVFIGVRTDLDLHPTFPEPGPVTPMSTVLGRAAVLWINNPRGRPGWEWERILAHQPAPTVQTHGFRDRDIAQVCLTGVPHHTHDPEVGCRLDQTYPHLIDDRLRDRHPRVPTIGELKALCGFPADYVLTGTYAQRWERLGRAVPPPMMRAIAATLKDRVLCAA